ncbi:MAG TPA: sigma-70 family RNA polymerase sigma factor [Terriglobales bacterium]|nr:sigma-70 family RNA polymerase sigma factor [Terriglobales bacterium]
MNVHISYKVQRTPDIDKEIQHWISKVQRRLQVFRPELVHLKGLVEQSSAREGTVISLNLRLPSGQMAVQESAASATSAIKAAFDDLLAQIGKHKELLRNSHSWRRHRVLEGIPAPAVPFETTFAAVAPQTATDEDVRSYLNANLRRLRLFVEREISFRENSGDIETDSVTWEEIVDEAVARALDDKAEKPDKITLEPWLYRLALQALNDFTSRPSNGEEVDLHSPRNGRNQHARDEARLQFYQPDETMTTESAIADGRTWTPEQIAYSDEMIALVQFALRNVKREDREAFILYGIEGFTLKEIAAIVDRAPEQVRQSIQNAREALRGSLPVENRFKDELLHKTRTA